MKTPRPRPKIAVVGSANIDYIMQMPRLPQLGETVTGGQFLQAFGGKGANQAVAAARAGAHVSFVGSIGDDAAAQSYLAAMESDGIDCFCLTLEPKVATGSALIMFDEKGDNYISVAPGANTRLTPEKIERAATLLRENEWIILQQEIPTETNRAVLSLAARYGIRVIFNYAPIGDLSLGPDASIHGLILNETEAAGLLDQSFDASDIPEVAHVAKRLLEKGQHQFVAVTLGANGVLLADVTGTSHLPAFAVNATDTTAAGDTFCGALTVALGEGKSLMEAAKFASAASALAVMKVGAQPSIPNRRDIQTFLEAHAE